MYLSTSGICLSFKTVLRVILILASSPRNRPLMGVSCWTQCAWDKHFDLFPRRHECLRLLVLHHFNGAKLNMPGYGDKEWYLLIHEQKIPTEADVSIVAHNFGWNSDKVSLNRYHRWSNCLTLWQTNIQAKYVFCHHDVLSCLWQDMVQDSCQACNDTCSEVQTRAPHDLLKLSSHHLLKLSSQQRLRITINCGLPFTDYPLWCHPIERWSWHQYSCIA